MRPFTYEALPGRVVFGPGAFERAADELERLGATRAAHRRPLGASWADRLAAALGARGARIDDVRRTCPSNGPRRPARWRAIPARMPS